MENYNPFILRAAAQQTVPESREITITSMMDLVVEYIDVAEAAGHIYNKHEKQLLLSAGSVGWMVIFMTIRMKVRFDQFTNTTAIPFSVATTF